MTEAMREARSVAVCAVRPFDRFALAALCRLDPRLAIRCSTHDPDELLDHIRTWIDRAVVLLGIRVVREAGGPRLVDRLHQTPARPRVVLVGTDDHANDDIARRVHADAYLPLHADLEHQLAQILG